MSSSGVKTEETKQHFDDIYVADTPVPFKERILDALTYVSDDFNRQCFDRLVLPWIRSRGETTTRYIDLAGCFGNTTMANAHGMSYEAIRENWRDAETASQVAAPRRFASHVTGIDISHQALAYGQSAGIYDETIQADLNAPTPEVQAQIESSLGQAQVLVSTAALVYLDPSAVERLMAAFASGEGDGYLLVNFLNPFALEAADATKRTLLKHFDYVGGMAARHRKMSELERGNYPGEDWVLSEIWVLCRR